jgi:hypothetical protein
MSGQQKLANIWFVLTFFVFLALGCANGAGQGSIKIPVGSSNASARQAAPGKATDGSTGEGHAITDSNVAPMTSPEIQARINSASGGSVPGKSATLNDLDEGNYVTDEITVRVGLDADLRGLFDFVTKSFEVDNVTFSYDIDNGSIGIADAVVPILLSFDVQKTNGTPVIANLNQRAFRLNVNKIVGNKKQWQQKSHTASKDNTQSPARWEMFTPSGPTDTSFKDLFNGVTPDSNGNYLFQKFLTATIRKTQDANNSVYFQITSTNGKTEAGTPFHYVLILGTHKQGPVSSPGTGSAGSGTSATGGAESATPPKDGNAGPTNGNAADATGGRAPEAHGGAVNGQQEPGG